MPSMQLRRDDVIVGVDTHKVTHVAVALDGLGGRIGDIAVPATTVGFAQLLEFCLALVGATGQLVGFGIEGTGSYGIGLARFLRRHGHSVDEIARRPGLLSAVLPARTTPSTPNTPHASFCQVRGSLGPRPQTVRWSRSGWSRSPVTARSRPAPPR